MSGAPGRPLSAELSEQLVSVAIDILAEEGWGRLNSDRIAARARAGKAGIYRYYTCYARQRHGTARCDQERIPADPLEEAIVAEVLAALDDGELFAEAARRARHAWEAAHPGRQAELAGVDAASVEPGQTRGEFLGKLYAQVTSD